MDRIYEHANEQHVRAIVVYDWGQIAFKDAEHTVRFTDAELENAFIKGCVIVKEGCMSKPIAFWREDEGVRMKYYYNEYGEFELTGTVMPS